jgi:RND family efflux transporter MFP subunit
MVGCALLVGQHLWGYYVDAPWTRDGRVSADVVSISPEVSGKVERVAVVDNQFVHQGDLLFQIDRERFQFELDQATATLEGREQSLKLSQSMAQRRARLRTTGAVSAETEEQARREAAVARADYQSAKVALDLARLNLERTTVKAPVDGYVTNLHLRPGDYAQAGQTGIAVIEADSFRVTGYFQETQLERIHPQAPVNIRLMGFSAPLTGHVESFGKGIADSNNSSNAVGLPTVEPVFTWVRLAQRIPVRVHIDHVPDGVILAAGMSASLYVSE